MTREFDYMTKQNMQFLFGDRELILRAGDLLSAPVDVIASPAKHDLTHDQGLAAKILSAAGPDLVNESQQLLKEYGELESGMAVYTNAGQLSYKAIIHTIGPLAEENDHQSKIELAISRSLRLCEFNEWASIAFPVITHCEGDDSAIELCAQSYFRAITSFWDARLDGSPAKIIIYLTPTEFDIFFHAFRNQAIITEPEQEDIPAITDNTHEQEPGIVNMEELQIGAEDDDINDWFK